MAEPASAVPGNSGSFASILASFTGAGREKDAWDDSALAEDVINLSYEEALRSVRGLRPDPVPDSPLATSSGSHSKSRKPRKAASVTIRLSEAEQAQLRERAAEAKLTLSAYLRSCIFETESLRAQVKEALAQMQAGSSEAQHLPNTFRRRRFRLFPWHRKHEA